jgi:cytochrome c oxidase subunit 3
MPTATTASPFSNPEQRLRAARLGWWVFLTSELLFFGPMLIAYAYLRIHLPQEVAAASRLTDFALGTVNTALLLTSSLCMALAVAWRRAGRAGARWLLVATAALGLAFLAIKGVEYHADWLHGLLPGNPARAGGVQLFFFLYFGLTGLHALHLVLGCAACLALAGSPALASPERVELAGLYWHFVDLVWIFLYPLLYLVGRTG